MGDIGGIIGGVLGTIFGNPMGTFGGIWAGSEIENHSQSSVTVIRPDPIDYSDATAVMSENNTSTDLSLIGSQKFQMHQAGLDREMQRTADLEKGMEGLDTRLQISKFDYLKQMTAEENRHVERMAKHGDLPPPEVDL